NQVIHQQHGMYFVSINKQLTDGQFKTVHSRKVLKKKATDSLTQGSNHSAADIDRLLDGQSSQSNKYLSNNDHFHPNLTGYKIMTNLL
ncbi:hydrolase, partial [Staphylococcus haemolyticus]